jgi:hypothetical protein
MKHHKILGNKGHSVMNVSAVEQFVAFNGNW